MNRPVSQNAFGRQLGGLGAWIAAAALVLLAPPASAQERLICIDPGHGGNDPGAVGCGLNEDEINLDTALKLRTLLQSSGFRVEMTRTTDTAVSLAQRSSYANSIGADRFVSIHTNAGGGTGIETYCHTSATSSSNGWKLADLIQDEMVAAWPLRDRGMKQANFHVLRETNMPATLTELAFIDSPSCGDATYLGSGTHRQAAAVAHQRAIQRHYGMPPGGGGSTTQGTARGVIFQDTGAGTADMSVRIEGATVTVLETSASVTTDANGNWVFTLNPGTYTIKATKAGFQDNQRTCTVTSGGTAWCSFGLFPASSGAKGMARGVIFEDTGAGIGDMSIRIEGATVRVSQTGESVVTDANGNWSFELDQGTYTLTASKAGYQNGQNSCQVTANDTAWCSFGLLPAAAQGGTAQGIVFIDLGDGSKTPLPGAQVTVLETSATATAGAGGAFSFELPAGTYTIKASMSGYSEKQVSCAVASGQAATCDIGLVPQTGVAQGFVYADKGNGNTDLRLSGATLTVVETSDTTTAGLSGDWSFELVPGTYTIRAAAPGFEDAERSCTVVAGNTTDCPIGMLVSEQQPDAGTVDDAGTRPDAGQVAEDAGTSPDAGTPDKPRVLPELPDAGCGCGTTGSEPAGLLLLSLASAALMRRRGPAASTASVAAIGLCLTVGLTACTEQEQGAAQQASQSVVQALETEPFVTVGEARELAEGMAPVLSPQGDLVAFTRSGFKGLYLVAADGGAVTTLTEEPGAGYAPVWDRDGARIAYRHPGQPFVELPVFSVDRDGKPARPFALHQGVWALQRANAIVLREGKSERIIAEGADRYFAPFLTRDGQFVIYNGLESGVWAYRRHDGLRVHFGEGSHPSVSEDGRYLVFTRTADDGEKMTAGDLFIADLADPSFRTAAIPLEGDFIELYPSYSSRAGLLVYSTACGSVRAAKLELR
ncbi:MAG: carboxypeptidase regulatory-like domain-containing protein [Myxococcales bacterium]|jgi:N-acetylmuramoyl-L-alanine amidase